MQALLSDLLQGRSGPLFWASAVAVAAGVTALAVSLLLVGARLARTRRLRALPLGGALRRPVAPADPRPAPAPAAPPAATALRAYQAQAGGEAAAETSPPAAGVEPGQGGAAVRLAPLLTRLRAAGNRLEEVALALEPAIPAGEGNSGLKTGSADVEYLFRTGV